MIKITADDFFIGLFSALIIKGINHISIRGDRFDITISHVFNKLRDLAEEYNLDIRFRIRLHEFHNDSLITRNAIYNAAQKGLISLDNPEYQDIRFKIGSGQAAQILKIIPGGEELFNKLAEDYINQNDLIPA